MSYTLIVVDMQPEFNSANCARVRTNCLREILKAINAKAKIIFLEYYGYDPTMDELTSPVLENLGNFYVKTKHEDDGSNEIYDTVNEHNLPKEFKICGVNTDCCVLLTVKGISVKFPSNSIEVIADACGSDWYHNKGLQKIKTIGPNIKLINDDNHAQ